MSKEIKLLAKDTVIYGFSSMLGRFLNWCLVPLYVRVLSVADNGIYSNIYAYTAVLLVMLTYGLETGFFRFINKPDENSDKVYSSVLISLFVSSLFFVIGCIVFLPYISSFLGYPDNKDYILIMVIVVAIDAFCSIPFAYLRQKRKARKFACIKLLAIFITIFFNIFFLVICPFLFEKQPNTISWFYSPDYGIGYVFVANLIGSVFTFIALLPYIYKNKYEFDKGLYKRIMKYSYPLLILGIAGILNQSIDKILYPLLFENKQIAYQQLGIYGSCFRLALIMAIFTQAYRFAIEPILFSKTKDDKTIYGDAMKYFVIFSLFIFLGVMFYMDIIKYFLTEDYFVGLSVVPIVMLGYIIFGIYFNLSFWYKMTDQTLFGALFSIIGCFATIMINILFVPEFGYIASAWASLISNLIMMALCYFYGQKKYPIQYPLKSIILYFALAIGLYFIGISLNIDNTLIRLLIRTSLLIVYLFFVGRTIDYKFYRRKL